MELEYKKVEKFLNNNDLAKLNREIAVLPKASFLFVTYNRCPYQQFKRNPLVWAFQTLVNNSHQLISDFVIVDDASTDYTQVCIKWLRKTYNISITYVGNKVHKEYSYNRRKGIKYVKNRLVFMGDDDCLYSKYFIVGSLLTYQYLQQKHPKERIAVINLPVYEKQLYPTEVITKKKIGRVYWKKTFFYHEFDKFPVEFLKNPKYLDRNNILLKPFKVQTFKGVNLCDKELILQAGNYLDLSMWKFGYSEHIELSVKLNELNFKIYHQADPKVSCLHLKYGNKTRDVFNKLLGNTHISGLSYNLGQIIKFSEKRKVDTGSRIDDYNFHVIEIGTFLSLYLKLSYKLGIKFAKDQYKRFVIDGRVFSTTPSEIIKDQEVREKIFWEGIEKGIDATQTQTKEKYPEFMSYLKQNLRA